MRVATSAIEKKNSAACTVLEYPLDDKDIDVAVAILNGRYPEQGWAINELCKETGYVIQGTGKLVTENKSVDLAPGHAVLIDAQEKFYWEGNFTVVLSSTPAWHPEQHKVMV